MNTRQAVGAAASIESHRLHFDGAGTEYFRVWAWNLLLGIATLGLYAPWARQRGAEYFHTRTEVAGITLDFWDRALRSRFGPPRWRDLGLRLRAVWREAGASAWPLFGLALLWAVLGLALAATSSEPTLPSGGNVPGLVALLALGVLLSSLWLARLRFNLARRAVRRLRVGAEAGHWPLDFSPFLRIALAATGVFALSVLPLAGLYALARGLDVLPAWQGGPGQFALLALALPLAGALSVVPALAYHEACTFLLVWNHVGLGRVARFRCTLHIRDYMLLRVSNAVFTVLTLGLYLPFSRVQRWRMKSASVTLHLRGDADDLADALSDALARRRPA